VQEHWTLEMAEELLSGEVEWQKKMNKHRKR
jgi:hypothetical protein